MTKINVAIVDDNEKMVSLLDAILRIRSRMLSFWI